MDHPLIGRPVLDETDFVASQHLDSVWDRSHQHDVSHIDEGLLEMDKQPERSVKSPTRARRHFRVNSRLAGCYISGEGKKSTRRKQTRSSAHDEEFFGRNQSEEDDGDQDVV
jgi:hypothetical protein